MKIINFKGHILKGLFRKTENMGKKYKQMSATRNSEPEIQVQRIQDLRPWVQVPGPKTPR